MRIYSLTNRNWEKLLQAFSVKNLQSAEEALELKKTILLISDDRLAEIKPWESKVKANEVILTELPGNGQSPFNKDELRTLIIKALGIISQ